MTASSSLGKGSNGMKKNYRGNNMCKGPAEGRRMVSGTEAERVWLREEQCVLRLEKQSEARSCKT